MSDSQRGTRSWTTPTRCPIVKYNFCLVLQMNQRVRGSKAMTIPDYSNSEIALWDGEKDHLELPDSIFTIGKILLFWLNQFIYEITLLQHKMWFTDIPMFMKEK